MADESDKTYSDFKQPDLDDLALLPVEPEPPTHWPSPPYIAYDRIPVPADGLRCTLLGQNGQKHVCWFKRIDTTGREAWVSIAYGKSDVKIHLEAVRSITLSDTQHPISTADDNPDTLSPGQLDLESYRPRLSYRIECAGDNDVLVGETIGHIENDDGLYLFVPVNAQDEVSCVFYPRESLHACTIGAPLGETLVQNQLLPSNAIEETLAQQQSLRDQKLGEYLIRGHMVTQDALTRALEQQTKLPVVKLGEILTAMGLVTPEHIENTLELQKDDRSTPIGELLIKQGLISRDDLLLALSYKLGYPVVELKNFDIDPAALEALPATVARRYQALPLMKRGHILVIGMTDPTQHKKIEELHFVTQCKIVPALVKQDDLAKVLHDIYSKGHKPVAAEGHQPSERYQYGAEQNACAEGMADTLSEAASHTIEPGAELGPSAMRQPNTAVPAQPQAWGGHTANAGLKPRAPPGHTLALQAMADEDDSAENLASSLETTTGEDAEEQTEHAPEIDVSSNLLVRMVNKMIVDAINQGASDIHIETYHIKRKIRIRFRKDGSLHYYLELPHTYRRSLIARLKIMCNLDISDHLHAQDGKIDFSRYSPRHKAELRVVIIPTQEGAENVVIRILTALKHFSLSSLGLSSHNERLMRQVIQRPHGMILCAGPTGSGKTTSLHAIMEALDRPELKIWTAEDPIEIFNPNLSQVQINEKTGLTFDKALRAFLRADPDVIMIGEVRDPDTAHVAVQAALTGHLFLSTLHTNSATETVTRLLDMGINRMNFADALSAALGQRLIRTLCPDCKQAHPAEEEHIEQLLREYLSDIPFDLRKLPTVQRQEWEDSYGHDGRIMRYSADGCPNCDYTGFKGRVGVHELLVVNDEIRKVIRNRGLTETLRSLAIRQSGFRTMLQDGIEKSLAGLVVMDDVRVHCATSDLDHLDQLSSPELT